MLLTKLLVMLLARYRKFLLKPEKKRAETWPALIKYSELRVPYADCPIPASRTNSFILCGNKYPFYFAIFVLSIQEILSPEI